MHHLHTYSSNRPDTSPPFLEQYGLLIEVAILLAILGFAAFFSARARNKRRVARRKRFYDKLRQQQEAQEAFENVPKGR